MWKNPTRLAICNKCTGEAHENAFIDNCGLCAPNWGHYFTCPSCTSKLASTKRKGVGVCPNEDCLSYKEAFFQVQPE